MRVEPDRAVGFIVTFLPCVLVPAGRSCFWLPNFIGLKVGLVNQWMRDCVYIGVRNWRLWFAWFWPEEGSSGLRIFVFKLSYNLILSSVYFTQLFYFILLQKYIITLSFSLITRLKNNDVIQVFCLIQKHLKRFSLILNLSKNIGINKLHFQRWCIFKNQYYWDIYSFY